MRRPRLPLLPLLALAVVAPLSACGSQSASGQPPAASQPPAAVCPSDWAAGWQRLANRAGAPVYCPAWVPSPLSGQIGGQYPGQGSRSVTVNNDGSYLVSLIWSDASGEVHVNFGGYLHSTAVPRCDDVETTNGTSVRTKVPCFSDPSGTYRVHGVTATLYTVNRGPRPVASALCVEVPRVALHRVPARGGAAHLLAGVGRPEAHAERARARRTRRLICR